MSSSPLKPGLDEDYEGSWRALNKLMRRGFSWSGNERHKAFWQGEGGRFWDVSRSSGLDFPDDGRAASVVDWDFDGDQDLVVTARTSPRVRLLSNETERTGGFISFLPRGTKTNPDAVGARVELELEDGTRLIRTVRASAGYLAQPSSWLHFGLGARTEQRQPVRVSVSWPGGERQDFGGLQSDSFYILREGVDAPDVFEAPRVEWQKEPAAFEAPPVRSSKRIVTLDPVPIPRLKFSLPDGSEKTLFGVRPDAKLTDGSPLLVVLTAQWCAPCRVELAELTEKGRDLNAVGIGVLALSVDAEEDREAADRMFEELEWPFARGFLDSESIAALDALQGILRDNERPLSLPTSFLVDGGGRLVTLYEGAVEVARVLTDRALLEATPEARRRAAAFSEGRWIQPPPALDASIFEGGFVSRGLPEVAREYARGRMTVRTTSPAALHHGFGARAAEAGRLAEAIGHFEKALAADPRYFAAWRDLGIALHRSGAVAKSVDAYRQALRLEQDEATRYYLGFAYLELMDWEGVRATLDQLRNAGSELTEVLEIAFARALRAR